MDTIPAYAQAIFACIRHRESTDDPTAVNASSGDSGLYQFATGTWLAHGGGAYASRAEYATVAEQDQVAVNTWKVDGFEPWSGGGYSCGGGA